jgi:hypothetical protein
MKSKVLNVGDRFYWVKLQSLDDWASGERLIIGSTVESLHPPTGMIRSSGGRYFRREQCYSTQEDALAALALWIEEQRVMLDEIRSEVEELRKSRG